MSFGRENMGKELKKHKFNQKMLKLWVRNGRYVEKNCYLCSRIGEDGEKLLRKGCG